MRGLFFQPDEGKPLKILIYDSVMKPAGDEKFESLLP